MIEDDESEQMLALPGADYVLTAVRTYGGYHAAWTCEACDTSSYCQVHNSAEEAIDAAERDARKHHMEFHSEGAD